MKIFIMLGIMLVLVSADSQASTIILKDGRSITGDIIQQDNTKVIVKDGDSSLTYYKDEITSIDGKYLIGVGIGAVADPEKEKLAEQFSSLYSTDETVSNWVAFNSPKDQRQAVASFLDKDLRISELRKLKIQAAMQGFSSDGLKFWIKVLSIPGAKGYLLELAKYHKAMADAGFYDVLNQEAKKAIQNTAAK